MYVVSFKVLGGGPVVRIRSLRPGQAAAEFSHLTDRINAQPDRHDDFCGLLRPFRVISTTPVCPVV